MFAIEENCMSESYCRSLCVSRGICVRRFVVVFLRSRALSSIKSSAHYVLGRVLCDVEMTDAVVRSISLKIPFRNREQ